MDIIHVNDAFLVVNKPPGMASVPGGWADSQSPPSLVEHLTPTYGKIWIVHRLDKGTSGVVLFARTAVCHRALSMLFESHLVRKEYHTLVCGVPPWQERTARHLLRQDVGHSHRTIVDHVRGKSAVTHFRVLECFTAHSFLQAVTETGRTHQVRAHAAALGFPLLGDGLYGAPPGNLLTRPALHARSLEFEYDGQAFSFSAPYPQDFQSALSSLQAGS